MKKYKTDLFIVLGLAVLALLYCYPQLQGKQLRQQDTMMWKAMAHEGMTYHDSTGKDVLWSNSMFGGMPTYTTYVAATNTNYPGYIQSVLQAIGKPAYFFFIAMLCFYLLARVLGVSRWLASIGAFAYAFASNNPIIIVVGHETKMLAIGYMPAVIAGFYLIFKEKWLTGGALFAVSMVLLSGTNHFQMMYYIIILLLCFTVVLAYDAISEGRVKQFFLSALVAMGTGLLGLMPNITSVLTTQEYAKETMRGGTSELSSHDKKTSGGLDKEYAFRWSTGLVETFCIMIPYMYGGATYDNADLAPRTLEAVGSNADLLPVYWGERPTQMGPVFFGAVVCFLFVLGMMVIRSPHKWWMFFASLLGIVLAWGKNLPTVNYFLFDHVPLLNKFRTVEMALVIPQFLFPLLGILGVQEIMEAMEDKEQREELRRKVIYAAVITAGICAVIGLLGSILFDFSGFRDKQFQSEMVRLLKEDRAALTMASALKSAVYILIAAGLLWAYLNDKLRKSYLVGGLALITVIDILPVAHNYLSGKQHNSTELDHYVDAGELEDTFVPREVDKAILQDRDPYYRVLDLSRDPYNDAQQAYYHKCVGGYHPAKMEMYQDLTERHLSNGFNGAVLNMLNTKYIILGKDGQDRVMPNPFACGNAWFVSEIKWVNTAEEEINALRSNILGDTVQVPDAFDPRKTAVIRNTFKSTIGSFVPGADSTSKITLTRYGLGDLSFSSSAPKPGLAVFSDIYYSKGWKAYIDGKETPIVKANYVLRAIMIPAGNHNIEFHFRPDSFYNGRKVAMAGSLLIIALCVAAVYVPARKRGKA
ncbi:YfhO family protein [Nemorincola caseinilytica]|uniref:YfhO family protein n=1 Tax=Nemorincola caseinilytica TaxID=2054315 RepID=UPI0031E61CEA